MSVLVLLVLDLFLIVSLQVSVHGDVHTFQVVGPSLGRIVRVAGLLLKEASALL